MKLFKKKRCDFCGNKILGLTFICKCNKKFCSFYECLKIHINDCNNKSDCESKIYLPKIVADKIEKI